MSVNRLQLDLQIAVEMPKIPGYAQIEKWVEAALTDNEDEIELSVRIVSEEECTQLNMKYRGKEGPTNVLSFPYEARQGVELNLLGDLVICASVVEREAQEQGKDLMLHWAHMFVHGVLHLRGYDHQTIGQAQEMEELETKIMAQLGYPNPYQNEEM